MVDKSLLSLSCVVYVDGVAGHEYVGSVDLITGDNSMATYTPDSSGNYTFNDDYKKGGHYYTNVGKDAAGNTTYNYYYYGADGSKKMYRQMMRQTILFLIPFKRARYKTIIIRLLLITITLLSRVMLSIMMLIIMLEIIRRVRLIRIL